MTVAERHLPADAVRPALILFTDGKHDVAGRARRPGAAGARRGSSGPLAVRPAAGRHGPQPGGAACPRERPRQPPDRSARCPPASAGASSIGRRSCSSQRRTPAMRWPSPSRTSPARSRSHPSRRRPRPRRRPRSQRPPSRAASGSSPAMAGSRSTGSRPRPRCAPIVDYRVRCRPDEGDWTELAEGTSVETIRGRRRAHQRRGLRVRGDGRRSDRRGRLDRRGRPR